MPRDPAHPLLFSHHRGTGEPPQLAKLAEAVAHVFDDGSTSGLNAQEPALFPSKETDTFKGDRPLPVGCSMGCRYAQIRWR